MTVAAVTSLDCLPFAQALIDRLAASELGGLLPGEKVVDLFCGAGGWGEGARRVGVPVDFAVNHSASAIATHRLNNPACVHHQGDAWKAKPLDVIGLGTKVGLLMASAACTTHSNARGKAPISKRVHMLGWCIARWMEDARPRIVMIENVVEWKKWGPLIPRVDRQGRAVIGPDGKPELVADPEREGQHYRRWLRFCKKLGYEMEERVIDAADVGGASRRKRLFLVGRCDGMPVCWPKVGRGAEVDDARVFSGNDQGQAMGRAASAANAGRGSVSEDADGQRARGLDRGASVDGRRADRAKGSSPESAGSSLPGRRLDRGDRTGQQTARCAADVIDWTDLGVSILLTPAGVRREKKAGRLKRHVKRPLEVKTLRRLAVGIYKHVFSKADPFVLRVTHGEGRGWHVSGLYEALPTQTTRQDLALVSPVVAVCAHGDGKDGTARWGRGALPVDEPIGTIHAGGNNFALVSPILATTGYGERAGQQPRAQAVTGPMSTIVSHAVKQGVASPVIIPCGGPKREPAAVGEAMGTVLTREDRGLAMPISLTLRQHAEGNGIDRPLPTLSAGGQHHALVMPVVANNTSGHAGGPVDEPVPTLTTGGQTGLVAPVTLQFYSTGGQDAPVGEALPCVTTNDRHALATVRFSVELSREQHRTAKLVGKLMKRFLGDKITLHEGCVVFWCEGRPHVMVDILFRMFTWPELARAMGFPETFDWTDGKGGQLSNREIVKMIGNAVHVDVAEALVRCVLPRGSAPVRGERVVGA